MFLAKASKLGRIGEYDVRSPMFKLDNWLVAGGTGAAPAAATSVIPGVSNTTAAVVGIGGLAAAAALAWYLLK